MKGFIQSVSELTEVPFDEMSGYRIIATNNSAVFVEGIKGIGNYSGSELEIRLKRGKIIVTGEGLTVTRLNRDEIFAKGKIANISIEE